MRVDGIKTNIDMDSRKQQGNWKKVHRIYQTKNIDTLILFVPAE